MKLPPLDHPLLGVDCHVHTTGLGLWVPPNQTIRPTVSGRVKVANRLTGNDALHMAASLAFQWTKDHILGLPPGVAVIEDPFLPIRKTTRATLRGGSYVEGGWGFLLAAYGWEVFSVVPSTWKSFFGATGTRKIRTEKLRFYALDVDAVSSEATPDEVDASMIALWWRMTGGGEELLC